MLKESSPRIESKQIILKTLTPLWTGGNDAKMVKIHETGIIGSMRWWYEAIIRGLRGYACDPSEHKESHEEKCEAAKFYGKTGYRRQFRLETNYESFVKSHRSEIFIPNGNNKRAGWHIPPGFFGDFQIKITQTTTPGASDDISLAWSLPLLLIHHWGALGAKTQHGFGVVKLSDVYKLPSSVPIVTGNYSSHHLPSLANMFFAKISFKEKCKNWWEKVNLIKSIFGNAENKNYKNVQQSSLEGLFNMGCVPVSPVFRNWLRYEAPIKLSEELFGDGHSRTHIDISSAYRFEDRWEVRIWGWVPASKKDQRDKDLDSLKGLLTTKDSGGPLWKKLLGDGTKDHEFLVWRELNSPRDTTQRNHSPEAFLGSLLKGDM